MQLLYQAALESGIAGRAVGIFNADADPLLTELQQQAASLSILQPFRPAARLLTAQGLTVSETMPEALGLALLHPAKQKQQTLGWMAEAMLKLAPGGELIAVCENKHGAKSYEKAMKQLAGHVASESKAKCRIMRARLSDGFDAALARQWLADAAPRTVETLGMISQPGLFSWDRPDPGSQLLLEHLPEQLEGVGMDLCCGYGLLAHHIRTTGKHEGLIHLIDADRQALACAMQNVARPAKPHWLDAATERLPRGVEWIVCNPPFHAGQARDVEMGQQIIVNACKALEPEGTLWLVANRKLPYEDVLWNNLDMVQTLTQEQGFKVIEGTK